ncbi:MAG: ATP phosphoribosyltransferase regulatory subunit [Casimicrobiaceae bacterium]|nr:ATP phosphoribosyltransferase regulatory subunit [Casimicrobiaceae bacterium]MCX8098024.1 ATP phosphoribosyltransferase regulatory subunit [Casimicrobiaceae bacterium]MDW8312448.1 ATP phosphoribosyltransferase regulatory subunit [Burkholderiales bacterium]
MLPDHVEDLLAPAARAVEQARRTLIDRLQAAGYELVEPPLVEHLEALLTGTGHDLEAVTFKLVDPLSGKLLGVRSDITPQIARIDATYFSDDGVRRFCYAGSVLRARAGVGDSRVLTQVGAELFGEPSVAGDTEILSLLVEAAREVNAAPLRIDLGHVGLFKALLAHFELPETIGSQLDAALAAKASSTIQAMEAVPAAARAVFVQLTQLFGEADAVLAQAQRDLPRAAPIERALSELAAAVQAARAAGALPSVDLADLPGLDYHTGLVFVAYLEGTTRAVARGGRYDGVGEAFVASDAPRRPATGFSFTDLRALATLTANR